MKKSRKKQEKGKGKNLDKLAGNGAYFTAALEAAEYPRFLQEHRDNFPMRSI